LAQPKPLRLVLAALVGLRRLLTTRQEILVSLAARHRLAHGSLQKVGSLEAVELEALALAD
jgi:hypothetical protein